MVLRSLLSEWGYLPPLARDGYLYKLFKLQMYHKQKIVLRL